MCVAGNLATNFRNAYKNLENVFEINVLWTGQLRFNCAVHSFCNECTGQLNLRTSVELIEIGVQTVDGTLVALLVLFPVHVTNKTNIASLRVTK